MSDAEFDAIASDCGFSAFTEGKLNKKSKHLYKMYSLQKVFDDEEAPISDAACIESPKLDGAAINLTYDTKILVSGATRGDGVEGEDVTRNVYHVPHIPISILLGTPIQITGELVCLKDLPNARNYASGAIKTLDYNEFLEKANNLTFIAYNIEPNINLTYLEDMQLLREWGFATILDKEFCVAKFRTDGTVYRINDNNLYKDLGHTAKHPRGAYARKLSSDVEIKETVLLEVKWQVGRSGKITPVAIFDEVIIDDAKVTKATLNNVGFIEKMQLELGDTILVTRSGGVIPKIIGKV